MVALPYIPDKIDKFAGNAGKLGHGVQTVIQFTRVIRRDRLQPWVKLASSQTFIGDVE